MGLKAKLRKMLKIDPRVMRRMRKVLAPIRRIGLKKQFTIFSNNCWGGRLYDKFSLPYLTPTIGLSMDFSDFIKFLENYEYYFSLELKPIEEVQKKVDSEWGFYDCRLGDITIGFKHYRNAEDAITKWTRRKERIFKNNIIVAFSIFDIEVSEEIISRFVSLPYKKIIFTNNMTIFEKYKNQCKIVVVPNEEYKNGFISYDKYYSLKMVKEYINQ